MSIAGILNTGRNALLAQQKALQVVSNNTANADTPGYSRRDVQLASLGPMGGVEVRAIRRRTEQFLGARMMLQRAETGAGQAKQPILAVVESAFAEEASGIGPHLDAFFNAMRVLATDPADSQLRSDVLAKAVALAERFRQQAKGISDQRKEADRILADEAAAASALTREIASLNRRIAQLEGGGQEASDLRDRRDAAAEELSRYVPIRTFIQEDGQMTVLLGDQFTLVQMDRAATFATEPDANLGGMRRLDLVSPNGAKTDVTSQIRSGTIGGLVEARDDDLPEVLAGLDALAYDLVTQVNTIHQAGFGTDGGTGRDFFKPTVQAGAASAMELAPGMADNPAWLAASSTAAEAVGGNDNLLALVDLAAQPVAGGGTRTFAEEVGYLTSQVGRLARDVDDGLARASLQLSQLEDLRNAQLGVSLDEEMIDLTRFQRAYQAGARVVRTVDEMYQTVLSM